MPELKTTIPSVTLVTPSELHPSLSTTPDINIYFSTPMMVSSLSNSALVNKALTLIEDGTDLITQLTFISYTSGNRVLKVVPNSSLVPGSTYHLQIQTRPDCFLSLGGRSLNTTTTYPIKVTNYKYPVPQAVSPGASVVLSTPPIFELFVVSPTLPSGEIGYIQTEISDTGYFNTTGLFQVYQSAIVSGTTNYSFTPVLTYTDNQVYWWRSRLYSQSYSSEWSEIYNFRYVAPYVPPVLDSLQSYVDLSSGIFTVVGAFDNGQANLQAWPDLTFYSTFPIALPIYGPSGTVLDWSGPTGSMTVYQQPVDGQVAYTPTPGFWDFISASGCIFYPTNGISRNTRYQIIFGKGIQSVTLPYTRFEDDFTFSFSGPYTPLYAWPTQLRALFGSYVSDVSEDLLCYHLYRASMEANRYTLLFPWITIDPNTIYSMSPSMMDLQTSNYNMVYSIHMWVIHKAMETLLIMKIYELAPCTDGKFKLGDYSQSLTSSNTLKFLKEMLDDVRRRRAEYELLFSRKGGRPRTPIKASAYPSDITPFGDNGYGIRRSRF